MNPLQVILMEMAGAGRTRNLAWCDKNPTVVTPNPPLLVLSVGAATTAILHPKSPSRFLSLVSNATVFEVAKNAVQRIRDHAYFNIFSSRSTLPYSFANSPFSSRLFVAAIAEDALPSWLKLKFLASSLSDWSPSC